MTLMEAINSGKNFKRPTHDFFMQWVQPEDILVDTVGEETFISPSDMVANDWELQPDAPSTFTVAQLEEAWNTARLAFTSVKVAAASPMFQKIKENLVRMVG